MDGNHHQAVRQEDNKSAAAQDMQEHANCRSFTRSEARAIGAHEARRSLVPGPIQDNGSAVPVPPYGHSAMMLTGPFITRISRPVIHPLKKALR